MGKEVLRLDAREKLALCFAINKLDSGLGYDVHPGNLMFVKNSTLVGVAALAINDPEIKGNKIFRVIWAKLREELETSFSMYLNAAKLMKRYGHRLNSLDGGKSIDIELPMKKVKVTVGLKWSLPKKDWEPDDDVHVSHRVVIVPTNRRGEFRIYVAERHRNYCERWLLDNFGN